uniref:Reverse transcriptase zinc-binding domain-containing protein n=1 Tax=Lactuca sativa TaxID=4236 RepID=A0A9R1WN02_LACSA|nr:hypothetical protein LSAT_V11C100015400 [Lactuca sativa]
MGYWRFLMKMRLLGIHGGTGSLDVVNGDSVTNGVWAKLVRSIRKMHDTCVFPLSTLQKRMGRGNSIMFWKDIWVRHQPFAIRFDRLYKLDISPDYFVSDRFYNDIQNWTWRRSVRGGREEEQIQRMLEMLHGVQKCYFP